MTKSCIYKVIMGGSSGSGKSTFLNGAYIPFNDDQEFYRIGVSFKLVDCIINNEDSCLLQIWDFKANSTLKSMYPSFCKGAKGSFLCFDLTDRNSFNELEYWIKIIREMAGNIPIILIGTKNDLDDRAISDEEIDNFINKFHLKGVYFTSLNNINRETIFKDLLESMDHFSHIFQLNILIPDDHYDFESFIKIFSVCPVCNRKNHYNYLKRFYFAKNHEIMKIKESLLELIEHSRDFDFNYYNKIRLGIPCCKCFKQMFETN